MGKSNWILISAVAIAFFARWYGLDLDFISPKQKASIIISISLGTLSVIGLYFLVKELFDEKLAAISALLLAVSSWHIAMSQSGAKEIFTSFVLISSLYFIWHGLKYGHTFDFFPAGLLGGAGFFAGRSYFVAPILILILFWNYWDYVKKDFSLSKYHEARSRILKGFSLLVITAIATALPIGFFVWQNPSFVLSAESVFSNGEPATNLFRNIGWAADRLLLIDFEKGNLVSWPVIILFAIGLVKEFVHWLKRKHGHYSAAHTLIFSWLFVMPAPVLLSAGPPSESGLGIILPPVLFLSAKGLWWIIEKLNQWGHETFPRPHKHWASLDAGPFLAMIGIIVSIALLEIF